MCTTSQTENGWKPGGFHSFNRFFWLLGAMRIFLPLGCFSQISCSRTHGVKFMLQEDAIVHSRLFALQKLWPTFWRNLSLSPCWAKAQFFFFSCLFSSVFPITWRGSHLIFFNKSDYIKDGHTFHNIHELIYCCFDRDILTHFQRTFFSKAFFKDSSNSSLP